MELYLDSANIEEIEKAFDLGFLAGLTTTPTFMHRHGITDIDAMIIRLSKIVPVLQIEALGNSAEEIVAEAERLHSLGLEKDKTVYKIPISLEGAKACKMLRNKGFMVNLHLVYTLQQAYIALSADATYVCPLVGRLQDQGHNALDLVEQCVGAVERYGYNTKVMFSSVRHAEHVRNALNLGVHTCTIPWKVMKNLASNHFTDIGTQQFFEHNKLMMNKVREVIRSNQQVLNINKTILDALIDMTRTGLGAVTLVDDQMQLKGIFTDGDLRRLLKTEGEGSLQKRLNTLNLKVPISVDADVMLYESSKLFKTHRIDNLVVVDQGLPIGILDIQDLV